MDCIFCKIIKGDIPSYKIYEDEYTYAFLDISKDIDGHTLVVCKKHYNNVLDADEETLAHVMSTIKKISNHYINNCGYDGVNILNNNNEAAEQSVMHLHFHIIPRYNNDNNKVFPTLDDSKSSLEEMYDKLHLQQCK